MSSQYGGNKNPPWARQDFGNQSNAGIMQAGVAYPFTQAQGQYSQQQQLTGTGTMQVNQAGLMSQSMSLPSSVPANSSQMGLVNYPPKNQNATSNSGNQKQRIFTGSVTKMHDNFGFVDEEVFFQVSCVKGLIPKVGDRVLVEASYNANMPFKWNASRVITLPDSMGTSQIMALQQQQQQQQQHQHQQQQQQQLKAIQQQAIGLMGAQGMMGSIGNLSGGQGLLSNPPGPPPLMTNLAKFQNSGMFRQGINTGPGLLGDPGPRTGMMSGGKDQRGGGMLGVNSDMMLKERDRRDRERRDRREVRRKRSRSPPSKRSHSPPPRARSPVKRRVIRPAPRYVVQVPKVLLDATDTCVISLKSKYANLYIPSDFFHASYSWVNNFPLSRPFTLGQACSFHVMHKEVPPILEDIPVYEPNDADHLFSAKVMLLASPSEAELYKKSCCLAEDLPDAMDNFQHPTRLLHFLVGTRGKNEPMAIGGPWSPSLDGANPQTNPMVLIKTAIRTTLALTGIDLSSCTQWYRFAEIRYFRPESRHKDRVEPARVETVVLFLPDVWNCSPTRLEWEGLQASYQRHLQLKINPEAAAAAASSQTQEEENEDAEKSEKTEASHFSTLDPKVMKVGDLRAELEHRNISSKGLKSQLIARLCKALKAEQEKEEESKEIEAEKAAEEETVRAEDEMKIEEKEEENSETKKKEDEEQQKKDKRERAVWERRYKLPEQPTILVHPSATAKSGKFDCSIMSLSVLLDYRPEDNKEHSFEVSLFAELFNEMLMRDFGFQIYKAIVNAPAKNEGDKKKTEKKDSDEKDKDKEKDKKEDKKNNDKTDEPSPKRRKNEDKDEKDDKKDKCEDNEDRSINGDNDDDEDDDHDRKDKDKKRKDEEERKVTVNPLLLLACSYFDQNHTGYLTDKDTEEIVHTLGLKLSRAQIKKLITKVAQRDSFRYRSFTDSVVDKDGNPNQAEEVKTEVCGENTQADPEQLAKGNKESLRKLLELSGVKEELSDDTSSQPPASKDEKFVYYKGALLDIESLMQKLDRSEKSRTALEKNMQELTDQLKSTKASLTENECLSQRLQTDLRKARSNLDQERSQSSTLHSQHKEWSKLATESRSHLLLALNSMNSLLGKDEKPASRSQDSNTSSKGHIDAKVEKQEKSNLKKAKDTEKEEQINKD